MTTTGEKGFGVTFTVLMITAAAIAGVPADGVATATDARSESPVTGSTSSDGSTAQTTITGCTEITDPGSYVLTADVINSTADTCILISASNVVLDGDGHTVDGVDNRRSLGVSIRHPSEDLENITVRNLILTDWRNGLESTGGGGIPEAVSDIRVAGVTARSNTVNGIEIGGKPVRNVELIDNHVRANGDSGIEVGVGGDATNVDLIDNVAIGNVEAVPGRDSPRVETFRSAGERYSAMSSSDGGGLMSSAGLVRYFDSEDDKGPTFDPKTVIAFSTLLGIFVLMLNAFA